MVGSCGAIRLDRTKPSDLYPGNGNERPRALSSVWTECLASDQVVAGSNPAAPICFVVGLDPRDGGDFLIKEIIYTPLSSFALLPNSVKHVEHEAVKLALLKPSESYRFAQ